MGTIPSTIVGKIQFAEAHVTPWTDNSVAMGSTAPIVASWHTKVTAARAALTAQQAADLARRDATNALHQAVDAMMVDTATIVGQVRSAAKSGGDAIWELASLPVPPTPGPAPAPGKPTDPSVSLSELGVLTLKWKCANPPGTTGTIYQVWRKLDGGERTYLSGGGDKFVVDATIPMGTGTVMYYVQAVRSTTVGEWSTFNVQFGVNDAGAPTIKSVTDTSPKIAA